MTATANKQIANLNAENLEAILAAIKVLKKSAADNQRARDGLERRSDAAADRWVKDVNELAKRVREYFDSKHQDPGGCVSDRSSESCLDHLDEIQDSAVREKFKAELKKPDTRQISEETAFNTARDVLANEERDAYADYQKTLDRLGRRFARRAGTITGHGGVSPVPVLLLGDLSYLILDSTGITDSGLENLLEIPSLEELDVSGTSVTDAGLSSLLRHPNLRVVVARRTGVTRQARSVWLDRERVVIIESEEDEEAVKAVMAQQFADYLFEETEERYLERAVSDRPVSDEISEALLHMREWLGRDLDQDSGNWLYTIGVRAYLWRGAEQGPTSFIDDEIKQSIATSLTEGEGRGTDEERAWTLFHAASRCLEDNVSVGLGSPGGLLYGSEFLWRGFEAVRSDLDPAHVQIEDNTQRLGFRFGVCLHDAERIIDDVLAS